MSRSYWLKVFAFVGLISLAFGSGTLKATAGDSPKIETGANRSAANEQRSAGNAIAARNVGDRKNAVKSDCGTPKECRAEQRQKDDLVAQQTVAQAAVSQRNAAWWQTGVGAAGVMLLILTVIYTHLATSAAINSVKTLIAVERARIAIQENDPVTTSDGKSAAFRMFLSNDGRSAGVLRETCITHSKTGLFKDFIPENVKKQNKLIPMKAANLFDTFSFDLSETAKFIVGYYKFSTIFSDKLVTDYFCFELGDAGPAVLVAKKSQEIARNAANIERAKKAVAEGGPAPPPIRKPKADARLTNPVTVPTVYRTDLDWPPDED